MSRRTGRPIGRPPRPNDERFWEKVEIPSDVLSGCWLWTSNIEKNGYGVFSDGDAPRLSNGRQRQARAHRWSYENVVGPVPAGLVLDHLCRVRHCVNPAHLEAVTVGENTRRSPILAAPTWSRGASHANSKLSDAKALAIFHSPKKQDELAAEFGVSQSMVSNIKRGRAWSWLTGA